MNETHDPNLRSWVESANEPDSDFPIQNLPFGVFTPEGVVSPQIGIAIGDQIVDMSACYEHGLVSNSRAAQACLGSWLNNLMGLDPGELSQLRAEVSALLSEDADPREEILFPMSEATMLMPVEILDYTDFYASINHATNVGSMFRPDNPLLPNYKYVPIGYHGRASSIVVSGSDVIRPLGQMKPAEAAEPSFGPSQMLDYESELGLFVGQGNMHGEPFPIDDAASRIFGFCLVNDWSARDIQSWEYQPLGPFLAKNFSTSISPWIVTAEALEPYRIPAKRRAQSDPKPLPYLFSQEDQEHGGLDITMEVYLASAQMREVEIEPVLLSRAPFSELYWTFAQMLTHHASNGCNLRTGDLIASGTVSGDSPDSRGCMLELTWRGQNPVTLPTGEERRFLQDGDEVIMRGYCEREGHPRIGFGECRGTILPPAGRKL